MPDDDLLTRIRSALDAADIDAFALLLAPDVTWGSPGDPNPTCKNSRQVLKWYQRGFDQGVRGTVAEITAVGDNVLVGMIVTGNEGAEESGGQVERWQVLKITDGLVSDIRGFEDRPTALTAAGSSQ